MPSIRVYKMLHRLEMHRMNDSEVFIIGANGQLGTALRALYPNARSADIDELDITSRESVQNFDWSDVNVLINAAAYTNVDGAETAEGRRAAWNVNATAVSYLSEASRKNGMTFVHVSSDYVFDGTNELHTEEEAFSPLSVYAQTKAAGDIAASHAEKYYIVRTSWVIGEGKNFVRTMKELGEKGIDPSVVNDQIGRLTFTSDLASAIKYLLENSQPYGTYNLTNDGESVSWADIAKEVYSLTNQDSSRVTGIPTEKYYEGKEGIAPRPLQSTLSLDKIKATGFEPREWKQALREYLDQA
jgi:dTDP-4-dehydrorhamnose reductase